MNNKEPVPGQELEQGQAAFSARSDKTSSQGVGRDTGEDWNFFIDSTAEAIITTDRDFRITGWNKAAEKIYGWQAGEVTGQKREDVLGTLLPNGSRWDEKLALAAGNISWAGEVIQKKRDRTRLTVHSTVTANRDQEGNITGLTFLNRDLTLEKTLADKLATSEAQFKALAETVPELVWLADERGQTYWYNRRWYEYTGASPSEMTGSGWQKVHSPEYLPRLMERIGQAFRQGKPWEDVFPLKGRGGIFRMFLTRAVPINDEKGKVVRWLGTNTDISELRDARAARQECEDSYRRLLDNIDEGFALLETPADSRGKIQDLRFSEVNKTFEDIAGVTRDRLVGNSLYAVFPSEANTFFEQASRLEETNQPQEFEWTSPANGKKLKVRAYTPRKGFAAILLRAPG